MKKQLFLLSMLFATVLHAASFDDVAASPDARKKLQGMLDKEKQLEDRINNLEAVIKSGSLTDMLSQIESLKQATAKLRGDIENLQHQASSIDQHQKELYQDLDERLRKIEAKPLGNTASPESTNKQNNSITTDAVNDQAVYDQAKILLDGLKYKEAFDAYTEFVRQFPQSTLLPEAKYDLGYAQFGLKHYKAAISSYQKLIIQHPDFSKIPDAMLNIANAQIQLALVSDAKKTLKELIKKYPNNELVPNAQKRLKVLESIKP